jgi:hypothetical protein
MEALLGGARRLAGGHMTRAIRLILSIATLCAATGAALAYDDALYPNLRGQWYRSVAVQWDPTKPPARGQQVPLTPEYQAVWDVSLAEQRKGGQDYKPQVRCLPSGMPQMMIGYEPMEFIVTPDMTFMRMVYMHENRHIYTDGRTWPARIEPSFAGYSIGKWVDENGDGRYDVLEIETRGFKGPRIVDPTGIPLHADNQTVIKERFRLDPSNPDAVHDEITTIDNAFTRPWTVTRKYKRQPKAAWAEYVCAEHNTLLILQKETYFIREDGYLMPSRRDQPPPDLRKFTQTGN